MMLVLVNESSYRVFWTNEGTVTQSLPLAILPAFSMCTSIHRTCVSGVRCVNRTWTQSDRPMCACDLQEVAHQLLNQIPGFVDSDGIPCSRSLDCMSQQFPTEIQDATQIPTWLSALTELNVDTLFYCDNRDVLQGKECAFLQIKLKCPGFGILLSRCWQALMNESLPPPLRWRMHPFSIVDGCQSVGSAHAHDSLVYSIRHWWWSLPTCSFQCGCCLWIMLSVKREDSLFWPSLHIWQ